jgi:RNA polymerase sigma-70 factor (ECF subfamily)
MSDPIQRRLQRGFATTRWGIVRAAAGEGGNATSALESLCKDYWEPVHSHVLYRVSDVHLAEDLTQEFFSKFLSQGWFLRPREERGKFRTFLLTVLRRFLNDELQRSKAWKRGGRNVTMSLDEVPEIPEEEDATRNFDQAWAKTLLARAFDALRKESDGARFDQLSAFLQREPDPGEYGMLSERFDMTPNTIAAAVRRLRRRFRDLLREEVKQTLAKEEDVDEEMRHLLHLLAA